MKYTFILALLLSACGGGDGSRLAPPLSLPAVGGDVQSLQALRGQVVLVTFWATWCSTCRTELPRLRDLRAKHRADGFQVLAVSVDDDPDKAVPPFAREHKLDYPMLAGNREIMSAFAVRGLPALFLIDRDGVIARRYLGEVDIRALENDILSLLKRRPA